MSSSPPSPGSPQASPDGDGAGDPPFDFADAAETLVELQEQLRAIEAAKDEAEGVADVADRLRTASSALASGSKQLRAVAEKLAAACEHLSDRPDFGTDALRSVADELGRLHGAVEALDEEVRSRPPPDGASADRPRRPSPDDTDDRATGLGAPVPAAVLGVLLLLVIGLQAGMWATRPAPASPSSASVAASADTAAGVSGESAAETAPRLYPASRRIASLAEADVRVLNGVGKGGLAATFRQFLEGEGVSVVGVGNAPVGTFPETQIYVHRDAFGVAEEIAARMGLPTSRVHPGPPGGPSTDITVVVGADHAELAPGS